MLEQFGELPGWTGSGGGGGGRSLAGPDGAADLGGVEVVLHQAADDLGELGLHQGDAESLQGGVDGSQSMAEPLDELEYFVNGGVTGQELINVSHHVNAHVAQQTLLLAPGMAGSGQEQQGDHELHHLCRLDLGILRGVRTEYCLGNNFTGTSISLYSRILIFLPLCPP